MAQSDKEHLLTSTLSESIEDATEGNSLSSAVVLESHIAEFVEKPSISLLYIMPLMIWDL